MQHLVENLQFKAKIAFVSETSACFKSVNYPPKSDFAMSIDHDGNVISRYGDDIWDLSSFGAKFKLQFGEFDETNKALFKQLMFYVIYSHLFPGSYNSLMCAYVPFQNIFRVCTKYKLDASDVRRFPKVVEEAAQSLAKASPSKFSQSIYWFHAVLKNQEHIGFLLFNEKNIVAYKQFDPAYELGQTPYIPNRIWTMLIQHLDSVLDDFETHQNKLEALYHFLAKTTLLNEKRGIQKIYSSPFNSGRAKDKIFYSGSFNDYLLDNDLQGLFEKYSKKVLSFGCYKRARIYTTSQFGSLLNNVSLTCYLYVLFYSIMRKEEALSLRTDCLKTEVDERLGKFYLLVGETTKTDPDSDARWVVPKRVERAVEIAKTMADWKLQYAQPPKGVPYLFEDLGVWKVANRTSKKRSFTTFDNIIGDKASQFFNLPQYTITQADYDEALALTPSLIRQEWFKVGTVWRFGWHQFRRTLAVHFAINKVSVSSTQLQMKHGTREQQFHYQNNAGRLRLNRISEQEVANEYYAEMSRNITSVVNGERVLPHAKSPVKEEVVRIVTDGDRKKLLRAQKNGAVGARKNIIGWCMKQGECEFGGFTTIAPCTGGDSGNPCSDVVIDGAKEEEFKGDMVYYENKMSEAPEDSPLHKALKAEVNGYKNVITIIEKKIRGVE